MRGFFNCTKLLIIFPLIWFSAKAQTKKIDSLKKEIYFTSDNNNKLNILFALCNEKYSLNPDTSFKYATEAKRLAIQQNNKSKIKLAEYHIASIFLIKGLTDTSLVITENQLKNLHYIKNDKENYVNFYLLKARALNNLNQAKESLNILYPLLNEAEKQEDTLTQIRTINSIVGSYVNLGQDVQALDWGYKALHLYTQLNLLDYAAAANATLSNLSLCYIHLFESKGIKKYIDSAENYITQAISLCRKNEFLFGLAFSLGLKGTISAYLNKPGEGEAMLKESLKIYKEIGNVFYVINTMAVMGNFYKIINQPQKGVAICKEGIALSGKLEPNYFLYQNLADNYKLGGHYLEYGETLNDLLLLKDSLYTKNSAEALSEMQTKYEVQKKENTIITQKLDLTKKNNLIYGTLLLLIITLGIGFYIFKNRKKNQQLKLQELIIDQKKKTTDAVMQAGEDERKRIAEDLHDSVAQKMVVAKLNLEAFEDHFGTMNQQQQHVFDNVFKLVDESTDEVRNLSHSMMPQAFFKSGLTNAVKSFIDKIDNKKLHITFNAEGSLDAVDKNKEIMIYRVIQECIQNVLKHAQATELDISIMLENDEIDVTIEDNGIGSNDIAGENSEGIGMKNIRSRIDFLNGKLDINSQPGKGSLIAFYIPLDN